MIEQLLRIGVTNAIVAAGLAVAVYLITRLFRNAPLAHLLWLGVLLKLVTPPIVDLPVVNPYVAEAVAAPAADGLLTADHRGHADLHASTAVEELALPRSGSSLITDVTSSTIPEAERGQPLVADASVVGSIKLAAVEEAAPRRWTLSWLTPLHVIAAMWAAGAVLMLALTIGRLVRFTRLVRHASLAPSQLIHDVAELARLAKLNVVPELRICGIRVVPSVMGAGRGAVILLSEPLLKTLSDDQRATMLAHELAHLRRRDHWLIWLEIVVTSLYWWHPVAWLARRQLRRAADMCCDGWVLKWFPGKAVAYAESMMKSVEFLGTGSTVPAAPALGFGRPNQLIKRFDMVLQNRAQHRLTRPLQLAVLAAGLILLPLSPLLVVGQKASETLAAEKETASEEDHNIRLPAKVKGRVVSEKGEPVADARVVVELVDKGANAGMVTMTYNHRTIRTWRATTDEAGRYEIDTGDLGPQPPHRHFNARARAAGYAEYKSRYAWTTKTVLEKASLETIKLPEGRVVRGRVLGPGGGPASNVVIQKAGNFNLNKSWFPHPSAGKEDGTFEITIPTDLDLVVLLVVADDLVPRRLEVAQETKDLGDIAMRHGTILTGHVLNQKGKPVAGAVVAIEEVANGDADLSGFKPRFATKSDEKGRYRFPPVIGTFKLWVTHGSLTYDRIEDRYLRASAPPPFIAPRLVEVDGEAMQQEVELQAGPTLRVQGTIRWADGTPVPNASVTVGTILEGTRRGINLGFARTNKDGVYSLELLKPMRDVSISTFGARDADGEWHQAHPADAVRAHRKQPQFMTFKLIEEDLKEADWELRPLQQPGVRRAPAARPGEPQLQVVPAGRAERTIQAHEGMTRYLVWSPDGKSVASGSLVDRSGQDEIRLWDVATGKQIWNARLPDGESPCSLAFSPDGSTVALGGNGRIALHDAATGERRRTLTGHGGACVFCIAFSADGSQIATGGGQGNNNLCLWDAASGELKATLVGHEDEVISVAFSRDGKQLISAAGQKDPTVRLWNIEAGRLTKTMTEFTGTWRQAFSRQGDVFAEVRAGRVTLWDVRTGKLRQSLKTSSESSGSGTVTAARLIQTVTISYNSKFIAAGDSSGTIDVWDAKSGSLLQSFDAADQVNSIAFSRDGKRIAAGCRNGGLRVWKMASPMDDSEKPRRLKPVLDRLRPGKALDPATQRKIDLYEKSFRLQTEIGSRSGKSAPED